MPRMRLVPETASEGTTTNITTSTSLSEGNYISATVTSFGGNVRDADGLPDGDDTDAWAISWYSATSAMGPWNEDLHNDGFAGHGYVADDTETREEMQQNKEFRVGGGLPQSLTGMYLRVCAFYTDNHGEAEGGTRNAPTLCSVSAGPIANVNDAPVATPKTVVVSLAASSTDLHTFSTADFAFTDEDGDSLVSIAISPLGTASTGTLAVDGTEVTTETTVLLADIGDITYYPPASQSANANYTSFTFKVTDDGSDGTGDKTSAAATITIALVNTTQADATGAPTVAATDSMATAYNEDVGLTASITGITEPNGIPAAGRNWQWQQSATMASAYTDIAGATATTFTPLQAHVGQFIRACLSFTDVLGNSEGPLCSAPAAGDAIANVNDAPVATAKTVSVDINASSTDPYTFSAADFEFTDEDVPADMLVSIAISALGTASTGTLAVDSTEVTAETTVMSADIGDITYYPPSGQSTTANYTSFTFKVTDDGSDGTGNTQSAAATITIDLVNTTQTAATGAPTVAATDSTATAHNEEVELTASATGVTEPNGIDTDTLMWQWQSAAAPASGDPDASAYTAIAGATAVTFTPMQAHVGQYIRACLSFTDSLGGSEGPLCSTGTIIANVNDRPTGADASVNVSVDATADAPFFFSADNFAFNDVDGDTLASITISIVPVRGTLRTGTGASATTLADGAVVMADAIPTLNWHPPSNATAEDNYANFSFIVSDGELRSRTGYTMTINLVPSGQDITGQQAIMIGAALNVAAVAGATNAIVGAMSAGPTASAFELSLDGTSLTGAARTLGQSAAAGSDGHAAWFLGTTPANEYDAAYNAADNSAESLLHRLQSMADGDIAMSYSLTDMSTMRFWARYQSIDISGNEGKALAYDGSGTGFYIGADNQITDKMRIGLAIGSDSADMTLKLDDDMMDDEASRSATTLYPYLQMDLGNSNHLRVIAGIGSGDLDIKSTVNGSTASAGLSWNMLAASISHHRPMKGKLSARFDGSLQLGNSSTDSATFAGGAASVAAADASTNEIAVNAQLRYQSHNFTPFASLAARKLGGDLSQSLAMDLGLGADLQTDPAIIRLSITRQLNDTDHKRDSLSLDASTRPNQSGLSASLGSRYDSLSGRAQWQSTVRWRRDAVELSLAASQSDYRLRARLRW